MSRSIMEALFDGRIVPWEQKGIRQSKEYRSIISKLGEAKERLAEKLSDDEKKQLEEVGNLYLDLASCQDVTNYSYGFTMGLLLMKEVLDFKEVMLNE